MSLILNGAPLFYPSAKEWMWNYCIYLGPYTTSKGVNYDLGMYKYESGNLNTAAIVYGEMPGEYLSGALEEKFYANKTDDHSLLYMETIRRAKALNLI